MYGSQPLHLSESIEQSTVSGILNLICSWGLKAFFLLLKEFKVSAGYWGWCFGKGYGRLDALEATPLSYSFACRLRKTGQDHLKNLKKFKSVFHYSFPTTPEDCGIRFGSESWNLCKSLLCFWGEVANHLHLFLGDLMIKHSLIILIWYLVPDI